MIADRFQHGKVGVDRRVDQPVRQVIGPHALPRDALLVPQPGAHQIEVVARPLLKRHHVVLAQEHAELFGELFVGRIGNPQHDVQVLVVELDLRPLMNVDDVLQRERMNVKHLGDAAQRFFAAEPDDIDPHHGPLVRRAPAALARIVNLLLNDAILVVRHHADGRRIRAGLDRHGTRLRSWRRPATNPRLDPCKKFKFNRLAMARIVAQCKFVGGQVCGRRLRCRLCDVAGR